MTQSVITKIGKRPLSLLNGNGKEAIPLTSNSGKNGTKQIFLVFKFKIPKSEKFQHICVKPGKLLSQQKSNNTEHQLSTDLQISTHKIQQKTSEDGNN